MRDAGRRSRLLRARRRWAARLSVVAVHGRGSAAGAGGVNPPLAAKARSCRSMASWTMRWARASSRSITLHRGARNYAQATDAGKSGEDLFVQAVREVGVLGVRTQVGERQYCDARALAKRRAHDPLPRLLRAHSKAGAQSKRNPERRDSPERRHAMGSVNRRRRARLATETRHARVEDPGQHECHRQTKRCRYDHGAHGPLGEPEFRHNGARDLNRTPGRGRVPRCGAEHLSPPELADQRHRRGR